LERVYPLLDDKTLTDWNALYIASLAKAGRLLHNEDWIDQAVQAHQTLTQTMTDENGQLHHRYRNGDLGIPAHADDYAHLIRAALQLYRGTGQVSFLSKAQRYQEILDEECWDTDTFGYFITPQREDLLERTKPWYDGAMPSINSTAAGNLIDLHHLTGETAYVERFEQLLSYVWATLKKSPSAFGQLTQALQSYRSEHQELVIVHPEPLSEKQLKSTMLEWQNSGGTGSSILIKTPENASLLADSAPFTATMKSQNDRVTYYLCRQFACQAPTTDRQAIDQKMQSD
jgi:uncharacterized protein YyaL (SSP411 family)